MGLKRYAWRMTGFGQFVDTVNNIKDEGNIVDGIKKTWKETIAEDFPPTKAIYDMGKYDGKEEGAIEISKYYECKFANLESEFTKDKQCLESVIYGYRELLDELVVDREKLQAKLNKTEEEKEHLQRLLEMEKEWRKKLLVVEKELKKSTEDR